ncbi:MAG: hypothetical protein ACE15C_21405 [Phycisphaerae bacterium]
MISGWLLVLVTIIGFAGLNLACKVGGMKGASSLGIVAVLYTAGTVGMFIASVAAGLEFSWGMLALAAVGGAGGAFGYLAFVKAMSVGHYAFTTAISCASFLVTVAFSLVFWEPITNAQVAGVALLVAAVFLITSSSAAGRSGGHGRWGRWAMMAGLAFALNSVPQICQSSGARMGMSAPSSTFSFTFYIYAAGAAVLVPLAVRMKAFGGQGGRWAGRAGRAALISGLLAAAGSMAGNVYVMFAMRSLSEKIVFPAVLSGTLMAGVLLSLAAFKEKINWIGYLGMAAEVAGIVVLNVFSK